MELPSSIESTWLERFAANPTGELSALLGGYAHIFPLDRLEPSTVLIEQFGDFPTTHPLRSQLDTAILDLLSRFRHATPGQIERHGVARLIHQVNEMFLTAGRLRLPQVLAAVGQDFIGWSAWANRLRLADYRDARLGLWRMVARNQDIAGLGRSLALHWVNLCGEVGAGRVSRAYLPVAFDGLHELPPRDGEVDSIDDLLTGVARWARSLSSDRQEDFLVVWVGLAGRLGLTSTDIQGRVAKILSAPAFAALPFAGWWSDALGMKAVKQKVGGGSCPTSINQWNETTRELIDKIERVPVLTQQFIKETERFIADSEAFSDQHGGSYDHGRNMQLLGTALLPLDPRLTLAAVKSSLAREPLHAHDYGLWARALMALQRGEAALKVLWQGISIDSKNVHLHIQLSDLLARLGQIGYAEALYRETMRLFPDNEVCRNYLARLLAEHGHEMEALVLYRETVVAFAKDAVCRLDLGMLLLRRGPDENDLAEVRRLRDELSNLSSVQANVLAHHLNRHEQGLPFQSLHCEAGQDPQMELAISDLPVAVLVAADAREISFRLGGALDDPSLLLLTNVDRLWLKQQANESLARLEKINPNNPLLSLLERPRLYRGQVLGVTPAEDNIRRAGTQEPTRSSFRGVSA